MRGRMLSSECILIVLVGSAQSWFAGIWGFFLRGMQKRKFCFSGVSCTDVPYWACRLARFTVD